MTAPVIDGWKVLPDYAEPATAGGGYVEVQENGDFEVAYEADASAREMGVGPFLLTNVPVGVIRALLVAWDARQPATEPNRRDGRREPTSTETDG